ncbi:MAG: TonB-dependent receptor [Massilibacteroides sp.]|nr:TonB-dependent receptor [Massilibacteroides sp.]MDD3061735.1 TonB-dependent receptor [Massilibacteroides sp.]MDD4660618.1 TonB-dependent receptor [Massilibacteroides sp.]
MKKNKISNTRKWVFVLLTVGLFLPSTFTLASSLRSHTMTIQMESATLKTLFELIEEQFDYTFLIRNNDIDLNERVTFDLKSGSVEDILKNALKNQQASFTVNNNRIIVYKTTLKEKTANNNYDRTIDGSQQQTKRVSGVVLDAVTGEPIIGANILVKGTNTGISTDIDGNFSIEVFSDATLVVSYIGYLSSEVSAKSNNLIIRLKEDTHSLDEVVVVAYGTTTKSSFTGSASVVKSEQIEKISGSGFIEALQGMSAGVSVINNEGAPGSDSRIQIRGISSMSGNTTPLYVVDGMPYDGTLTSINPSDIESMTVLKDAAASSLYGSRAANGVVMVTTKKGKSGKPVVNFRGAWGTSDIAVPHPQKANPYQQLTNVWQAIYNDQYYKYGKNSQDAGDYASQTVLSHHVQPRTNSNGETVYVTPFKNMDPSKYVLHDGNGNSWTNPELEMVWDKSDWDWYDAVYSKKLRQDYSIDLSGSTNNDKTRYFTSIGYLDDKGYSNRDYYKRYSFRTNVSSEITDWLSMGGNLAYSYARRNAYGNNRALVFSNSLNSPYLRNADNTDWVYSKKTGARIYDYAINNANFFGAHVLNNGDYWDNPNDEDFNNTEYSTIAAQYYTEIKLPYSFKYKMAISLDDNSQNNYTYGSAIHGGDQLEPYGVTVKTNGGNASRANYKTTSVTWNNLLTWDKTFGEHAFNVLFGQEYYHFNQQYNYGYGEGIMQMAQFELSSTTTNWSIDSNRIRYALLSFFGKADYNYASKYYLSTSFRRDGSSRFSKTSRWGNFFSVGASWRLSKEAFMESTNDWLDNLALRASYGTSGNDKLFARNGDGSTGDEIWYAYQSYYASNNFYGKSGYKPSTIGTPELKWERNKQFNGAVDFSLWNRVSGTLEYYARNSADLLYYKDLPLSAQVGDATGINTNLGNVRNEGFEFTLNVIPVRTKNLQWMIDFNISTLKNEVTYLPGGAYTYTNRVANYRLEEGKSLYEFYMSKNAGVNPENGNMRYWVRDGENAWKMTENFSDVTTNDYQWCGSAIPKAFGSITNSVKWKDFDFSMMWYASFGSKIYDYVYLENTTVRNGVGIIQDLVEGKVWMKPGDNALFPRWSADDYSSTRKGSDFYLFDNDYYRLRNITIGYTLPRTLINKLHLSYVRVYVSGDNVWTLGSAANRHNDPETGLIGNNYNGNANSDNGIQSARRVFMGGVQVSF